MALTTMDGVVAAMPGQIRPLFKASATTEGAGTWHSLFLLAGNPGAGSTPTTGTGAIPTSATTGAIPFTNPVSGNTYLGRLEAVGGTAGTLIIYDRLWHNSGQVGNITTSQVVNSLSLTRPNSNGDQVELWGEVYTAMGATASTFTATYTNSAGTGSRSATYTMPANALSVGQMFPFLLAAGDTGVRSVQSVILSVSTGTAGNFGLTLLRRIASIPLNPINIAMPPQDFFGTGGAQIYNDACICGMVLCTATNSGQIQAQLNLIQG